MDDAPEPTAAGPGGTPDQTRDDSPRRASTDEIMAGVRARVRDRHPEADPLELAALEDLLSRARARESLLRDLLSDGRERHLKTFIRFESHRPWGAVVNFVKRRILFPVLYWLFDFSRDNFERQEALNHELLASIEVLAADNAALRRRVEALADGPTAPPGESRD